MKSLHDIGQGFKDHPHRWWYVFFVVWFVVGMQVMNTEPTERCFKHCDDGWR